MGHHLGNLPDEGERKGNVNCHEHALAGLLPAEPGISILQITIGPAGPFWLFAGGAVMSIVFVAILVPETKDRSLEEITMFWKGMNTIP